MEIQDNVSKAREYAAEKFKVNPKSKEWNVTTTYMSACEWKDAQFKEYLERKKEELEHKVVYGSGGYYTKQIDIVNEIINELFPATEQNKEG